MTLTDIQQTGGNVGGINNKAGILEKYGINNSNGGTDYKAIFNSNGITKATGGYNPLDPTTMANPSQVANQFSGDFRDMNKAQKAMDNSIAEHSFGGNFADAVNTAKASSITQAQAKNVALKKSRGNVKEILPEVLNNVSKDVDATVSNLTAMFEDVSNNLDQVNTQAYARVIDLIGKKAGIDMAAENALTEQWVKNKNMEYSMKGLDLEQQATEQKMWSEKANMVCRAGEMLVNVVSMLI